MPSWVIDPRRSKFIGKWDALVTLALIYTALLTPFEVAFLESNSSLTITVWNRFVDIVFTADMCLQFCLMYRTTEESLGGSRWISDAYSIAHHYVTTWFFIDLIAVLVAILDLPGVLKESDDVTHQDVSSLKLLRVLRVLRLIKLVRLLRASRMIHRWETRIAISYKALTVFKCVAQVLLSAHWIGCIWTVQTHFQDSRLDSWLGSLGYCEPETATNVSDGGGSWDGATCVSSGALWIASAYWATMVISGIGGADLDRSTFNTSEQCIGVVLTLFGGLLWSNVIAQFCGLIATLEIDIAEFRRTIDSLNIFMQENHFPSEMRQRLREYFHQTKHLRKSTNQQLLINQMSPMLQGEVQLRVMAPLLRRVWYFRELDEEVLVQISVNMVPKVFAPTEVCTPGFLYIVKSGVALFGGQVVPSGGIWGEDMILSTTLFRRFCAVAMTYLQVYRLSRSVLLSQIVLNYPAARRHLRRAALKLAFRRYMQLELARHRREMASSGGGASVERPTELVTPSADGNQVDGHVDNGSHLDQGGGSAGYPNGKIRAVIVRVIPRVVTAILSWCAARQVTCAPAASQSVCHPSQQLVSCWLCVRRLSSARSSAQVILDVPRSSRSFPIQAQIPPSRRVLRKRPGGGVYPWSRRRWSRRPSPRPKVSRLLWLIATYCHVLPRRRVLSLVSMCCLCVTSRLLYRASARTTRGTGANMGCLLNSG